MLINKKMLLSLGIISTIFIGCSTKNQDIKFNENYNLCVKNNMPLPYWVCKKNLNTENYILISFETYQFNSLEEELNQNTRKKVLQESVKKLMKKYKKLICSIINIPEKDFENYKNKIYNVLTNNINEIAFIDKIFVPFEQSNMRINSYILVAYNKKELFKIIQKIKTKNNKGNNKYLNYY